MSLSRAVEVRRASGHRVLDAMIFQRGGADLVRSARNDLLCGQQPLLDEASNAVVSDAQLRGGLRHGQPLTITLGRLVGMDAPHAAQ